VEFSPPDRKLSQSHSDNITEGFVDINNRKNDGDGFNLSLAIHIWNENQRHKHIITSLV